MASAGPNPRRKQKGREAFQPSRVPGADLPTPPPSVPSADGSTRRTPASELPRRTPSPNHLLYQRHHGLLGPCLPNTEYFATVEEMRHMKLPRQSDPLFLADWVLHPGTVGFREDFFKVCPPGGLRKCFVSLDNQIATFVSEQLEPEMSLDTLIVVSGKVHRLWASSCDEYVSKTWPNSKTQIKSLFAHVGRPAQLLAEKEKTTRLQSDAGKDRCYLGLRKETTDVGSETLLLSFEAMADFLVDLVEALAWLYAVTSPSDDLAFCGVQLKLEASASGPRLHLRRDHVTNLSTYRSEWESMCWLPSLPTDPLLPRTPVAVDFDNPDRPDALQGIELSFDLMCCLCGLEYQVEEDGGLMLYGQKSLVYPVKSRQTVRGCVEWHFEPLEDSCRPIASKLEGRLRGDDLQSLVENKRHFLGLWPQPQVTLGTPIGDDDKIQWSRARPQPRQWNHAGRQIAGSTALPKVLTLAWTEMYTVSRTRKSVYLADFVSKVHARVNTPVILYCVSERRAWMVSFLSVLLQLARARAQFQAVLGFDIPACAPSAHGGQAAFDTIMTCYRRRLKRENPRSHELLSEEEERLTVKDYLNDVWSALDCATRESNKVRGVLTTGIVGYEMADIACCKPDLYMKRERLGLATGWAPLLDEVGLVLFYEGLMDPIIPSVPASSIWHRVPVGFNLLTASLPCLLYVAERHTAGRLTATHYWHNPGHSRYIFGPCDTGQPHICNRLQELKRINPLHSALVKPVHRDLQTNRTGAVIFRYDDTLEAILARLGATYFSEPVPDPIQPRPPYQPPPTSYPDARRTNLPTGSQTPNSVDSGYSTASQTHQNHGNDVPLRPIPATPSASHRVPEIPPGPQHIEMQPQQRRQPTYAPPPPVSRAGRELPQRRRREISVPRVEQGRAHRRRPPEPALRCVVL